MVVSEEEDISDNELLEGLEDDEYREKRIRDMQNEIKRRQIEAEFVSNGGYREYTSEREVMDVGLKEAKAVVHFFHPRFKRCEIMDNHLELIAYQHPSTKFIKVNVENVPFLVEKLKIKVLPCVIIFKQGVAKERLIGFEELGNEDNFNNKILEWKLFQMGKYYYSMQSILNSKYTGAISSANDNNDRQEEGESDFDD
ncbi:thioredoxin-like protein [Wallemia mellicola]|nr:thioredoxin-like protein [Wallemia mellicola]